MQYTPATLDFVQCGAERIIEDAVFERNEFYGFYDPKPGHFALRNVQFISCRSKLAAMLDYGIKLDNVLFHNFACPAKLMCSSEAIVGRVTISGSKPHGLTVAPLDENENYCLPEGTDIDFFLDISNFRGKVEVFGFPRDKVIIDPERHVAVSGAWFDAIDWEGLGFDAFSFFRVNARLVETRSAVEGVFSLPSPKSDAYANVLHDKRRLEELGYAFT